MAFNLTGHTAPTLLRDLQWMHGACSAICQMSVAASHLLTARADLLEPLLEIMDQYHQKAAAGAAASLASVVATAIALGEGTGAAVAVGSAGAATAGAATAGAATAGAATAAVPATAAAAAAGSTAGGTAVGAAIAAGAANVGAATAAAAAAEVATTGAATVGVVGGATIGAPFVFATVAAAAGIWAWDNYKKGVRQRAACDRIIDGMFQSYSHAGVVTYRLQ